jgi:hypothetical protein
VHPRAEPQGRRSSSRCCPRAPSWSCAHRGPTPRISALTARAAPRRPLAVVATPDARRRRLPHAHARRALPARAAGRSAPASAYPVASRSSSRAPATPGKERRHGGLDLADRMLNPRGHERVLTNSRREPRRAPPKGGNAMLRGWKPQRGRRCLAAELWPRTRTAGPPPRKKSKTEAIPQLAGRTRPREFLQPMLSPPSRSPAATPAAASQHHALRRRRNPAAPHRGARTDQSHALTAQSRPRAALADKSNCNRPRSPSACPPNQPGSLRRSRREVAWCAAPGVR